MEKPSDYQTKNPIQKRSQLTRQKILDAAMSLIAEMGFEKTNTNLIAETAQVSIGTVYVHFKDKWEIFLTILDEFSLNVYSYLSQGIDTVLKQKLELPEIVEWLIMGLYQEHKLNGRLNLEIAKFVLKDPRAAEVRAFWDQKIDAEVVRLFEPFREKLPIKNISAAIIVAHRSAHQVFQYLYQHRDLVDETAILEEFISMVKRYIGA
jgi:AcrR family transcriptional regulator